MVSGATVTSDGYLQSLQSALDQAGPVTAAAGGDASDALRRPLMGMPISLALRGRHADDDAGARRLGRRRWPSCARSTGYSAPTGPTPSSPGSAAGEIDVADCPPEVAEVLALGARRPSASSGGAFASCRPGRDGAPCSTRAGWSRAGPSERAAEPLRACRTPTSACPPAVTWSAAPSTRTPPPWRIGIEDPRDPRRLVAVVPVRDRGGGHLRHRPPRRSTWSTRAPAGRPTGVASVTVVADS